jgi:hypothetical protein
VRGELANLFGLPEDKVRVIVPDTGSGYGGKHIGDAALEAARLAKLARQPVKLVWTREEEFTWAYFRPAGVIDVASRVDASGKLIRWEHRNYNSGGAAIRALYEVADRHETYHAAQSPLRQGSYRGLAGVANHFGREGSTRWCSGCGTCATRAPARRSRPRRSVSAGAGTRPDSPGPAPVSRSASTRTATSARVPRSRLIPRAGACGWCASCRASTAARS